MQLHLRSFIISSCFSGLFCLLVAVAVAQEGPESLTVSSKNSAGAGSAYECAFPEVLEPPPPGQPNSGPKVPCDFLPEEFIECEPPLDHKKNDSARAELGYGCRNFGIQVNESSRLKYVEYTKVVCHVLSCVECYGNRTFLRDGVPCLKYSGHYFLTTLLYSILLGFVGLDRFCLGYVGIAVAKLMTLGGFGIWWLVDIGLLINGELTPEDGSMWMPYY